MMRILAVAAMVILAPQLATAQTGAGDVASVASGGAALVRDGQTVAKLPANTWFDIVRVNGSWSAGYAFVGGERKSGWILSEKLAPASLEPQAKAAAAWEQLGADVERDARGAVLAIDASDSNVGDDELAQIAAFPWLEELMLGGSKVTDAGVAPLTSLPRLRRLFLDGLPITDEGLKPLGRLRRLEVLSLAETQITDDGAADLRGLADLQVLNLSQTEISDAALRHLAPLTKIETLALRETNIRGRGLAHLRGMERLNVVNLSQCPLEGEHLLHLAGMEHLRILHVAETGIDPECIERLEDETPSLAVFD
ncbi:MAG: hypothetical protein KY475_26205 [Planctomycetes bacterium]|nr:hypothetical protein [Planctomycetota bacterium]